MLEMNDILDIRKTPAPECGINDITASIKMEWITMSYLVEGQRPVQKPKIKYKDCLKITVQKFDVDELTWYAKLCIEESGGKKCMLERTSLRMKG